MKIRVTIAIDVAHLSSRSALKSYRERADPWGEPVQEIGVATYLLATLWTIVGDILEKPSWRTTTRQLNFGVMSRIERRARDLAFQHVLSTFSSCYAE